MRRAILAIISTAAMLALLLSFKSHGTSSLASPPAAVSTAGGGGSGSTSGRSTPSQGTGSSGASSSKTSKAAKSAASETVTGEAADTRYGPVQVKVTVKGGKVTAVRATDYPDQDPRDAQINSFAIPTLNQEATAAGSTHIDMVSGATYTSEGYIESLQSALDKAGL